MCYLLALALMGMILVAPPSMAAQVHICNGQVVTIAGTNGPDILEGTTGDDVIHAGAGHDEVTGLEGRDVICAGEGTDFIEGNRGADVLRGGSGLDDLHGGLHDDFLDGGFSGGTEAEADIGDGGDGDDYCVELEVKVGCESGRRR